MSNPNEDDIPSSSRRSRRSLASNSKQDRQSVLDQLKQARSKGKSYRARVDDLVQDVYMEVDDEEYQTKKQYNREFVEDDDGAGYYDEDSDEEFDNEDKTSKKKKTKRVKEKKGTIKHHFQAITSKQKQDKSSIRIANDDVLKETLAELLGTDNILGGDDENALIEYPNAAIESTIQDQFTSVPSPEIQEQFTTFPTSSSEIIQKQFSSTKIISPEISHEQFTSVQTPMLSPKKQRKRGASPTISSISILSKVARTEPKETNGLLKFYFIDAYEDIYKHPGTVYLFGRIKELDGRTENCCLTLRNISRQLFFLKRQFSESTSKQVTIEDLNEDVQNTLKTKFGITKLKCKLNLIEKKFISADQTVPRKCEVLEVWLNCNFGRIPVDLSGDCFSHVMNTTTTALERLLVERNIYGPCWLEIRNAEKTEYPVSHCPHEYTVNMEQMDNVTMISNPPDPPQISLIALNLLAAFNPETKENQIVMASLIHHICHLEKQTKFDNKILKNKRYCVISKFKKGLSLPFDLEDQLNKNGITNMVKRVGDEMALLNIFLSKLEELNPDMILGHDLNAQLILLQSKMEKHKLKKWDRLGRLKRSVQIPKIGTNSKFVLWELTVGRLCLDSKIAASELIHSRSYEMEDLVLKLLKINNRQNMEIEQISQPFLSTNSKIKLIDLIKWNWNENLYTLKIVENLNAIPLFVQITQIVGGVLSRTLMGGRAERNEYLLLHACFKNNCIPPNKHSAKLVGKSKTNKQENKKATKSKNTAMEMDGEDEHEEEEESTNLNANATQKKKGNAMTRLNKKTTQYTGGLVLEPKKGLYDTFIVLLDFNSLYPSIIQEFNICFTTVDNAFADLSEADLPVPPGSSRQDGILKNEIRKLVNRRREVKNLMKQEKPESEKYQQYNIRQMGLKLTANSMYGCLGFQNSRFYAKTLAAMVTSKGRELLMHTKTLVEKENFSVIYGDTDSIMVNTNTMDFRQAKLLGQKLKQIVNKNYSLLELDIDGIYKRLLLLKKKKYAALSVDLNDENNMTPEMKGLDIVRRDWSELAKDIGEEIVNLILTPSFDRDTLVERIRSRLAERRHDLDGGRFTMEKFEILKQLTRDPADYRDLKSQPHAIIAQRLNESKKFRLRQGDIVKYIICIDGTNNPATQRGYHSSEILANKELSIDKNYYLAQQIHPIVTRLVEPIEELDAYQISEVLGLDPSSYRRKIAQNIGNIGFFGQQDENEQFSIGFHQQDFSTCEGIIYECPKCQRLNVIRSAATKKDNGFQFGLARCLECGEDVRAFVKKQLHLIMADHIKKNCQVVYTCDDITCGAESYVVGQFQFSADGIACTKCKTGTLRKNYPDRKLFEQQSFFKFIADLETFGKQEKAFKMIGPEYDFVKKHYKECHSLICNFLDKNAYSIVDLSVVFAPLVISKAKKSHSPQ